MIRVLIADDQELIRQSLSYVLEIEEDISIVGAAANGRETIELVRKERPDVVLLDIRMPEADGVECTRLIKSTYPQIKVIILTTFDDDEYVFGALRYGASGYLLKGVSVAQLADHACSLCLYNLFPNELSYFFSFVRRKTYLPMKEPLIASAAPSIFGHIRSYGIHTAMRIIERSAANEGEIEQKTAAP